MLPIIANSKSDKKSYIIKPQGYRGNVKKVLKFKNMKVREKGYLKKMIFTKIWFCKNVDLMSFVGLVKLKLSRIIHFSQKIIS